MAAVCRQTMSTITVTHRGRSFAITNDPTVVRNFAVFSSGLEEGTLQFLDTVLPSCSKVLDVGAYVGFISLYCGQQAEVFAFEPNPTNFRYLRANVDSNPNYKERLHIFNYGLGPEDARVPLYSKGHGDSGSSIFQNVQRVKVISGKQEDEVEIRSAPDVFSELGADQDTVIKIDIEGAEFAMIPSVAELFAATQPHLHISFHPGNLVPSQDEYVNSLARIRSAVAVAEALASYQYMYLYTRRGWLVIPKQQRSSFLQYYLLKPRAYGRVSTRVYGFTEAVVFTSRELPDLRAAVATPFRLRRAARGAPLERLRSTMHVRLKKALRLKSVRRLVPRF
jgi:FkbM family methyltransferase